MNTSIKKKAAMVACLALLGIGAPSCDTDQLNPVPEAALLPEAVYDTPARVSLQINSLYSYVKVGNFLGGRYQVYGDVRADDFLNRTSNAITALQVWNHTLTETSQNDVINLWTAGYQAINQINVFLAGLDANTSKFVAPIFPESFATTTAVNYQAEARFLRALSYYSLLQLYAKPYTDNNGNNPGLPLRLQAESDLTNNDLARSSVADVYKQIVADLEYAEQNLPLSYSSSILNVTRAHRNTAIALKTRVYLSMGLYDDVIREANKIVSLTAPFTATRGVAHALSPSIAAVFAPPQETSESILSFPFTTQNQPGTQNQLAYYYLPASLGGTNPEFSLNSAGILANPAWPANDARRTSFVTTIGTASYLKKYPTGSASGWTDKAPVIRYAEVLLSLAEARFRTAGPKDPQAVAILNTILQRSNPAPVTTPPTPPVTFPEFKTVDEAVNATLLQRRIEFLGEGIRNIDLMRLKATIPGKGSVPAITPDKPNYIWPIPATELAANRAMTRN
ncbi:RagB/SusD family nutrient uptake outer membrane protein [Hymenobacter cavernae]|uniref:RagB/SusD family nutrient uptake outer membrane protein n=1 Tax=Hymenobacter cavernae TaxID=2044852 RepID=A0ABQ1TFH2_9BACT|nr:RagB/SusD family nutrient uptake outer membrane protein [Hymenobacter cavernae]GGE94268.1 hypothetical protein GCM10011383_01230 [Hymenobacter cavernae]